MVPCGDGELKLNPPPTACSFKAPPTPWWDWSTRGGGPGRGVKFIARWSAATVENGKFTRARLGFSKLVESAIRLQVLF